MITVAFFTNFSHNGSWIFIHEPLLVFVFIVLDLRPAVQKLTMPCYKLCHLRLKTVAMEEVEINIQSLFPFIVDDWRIIVQMLNGCNGYSWCK